MACLQFLVAERFSSTVRSTGSPIFLLCLLRLWSPVILMADLIPLVQGFPLFHSLADLEPRPQHFCSVHLCFKALTSHPVVAGGTSPPLFKRLLAVVCLHHALWPWPGLL